MVLNSNLCFLCLLFLLSMFIHFSFLFCFGLIILLFILTLLSLLCFDSNPPHLVLLFFSIFRYFSFQTFYIPFFQDSFLLFSSSFLKAPIYWIEVFIGNWYYCYYFSNPQFLTFFIFFIAFFGLLFLLFY